MISRGRRGIRIFTPDKAQLRENIRRGVHRLLALDLAAPRLRPSWFFRLVEKRWGQRAALIMERGRLARHWRSLRQAMAQRFQNAQVARPTRTVQRSRSIRV